jgi:uncharacterized membrane protein
LTKRMVKKQELAILKRELHYLEESGILLESKVTEIQEIYQVEERFSFTKTFLYVGSVLIGAGILSFIASNWGDIGKLAKFIFIIVMFLGCNLAGFGMEKTYPKTSRSLYYLGVLVFGAGIFLVRQMFHFGGDFQAAFLWWSLGIIPLAWALRDKWILLLASLFAFIYMTDGSFLQGESIPYWILLWIVAIYIINEKIGFSKATGFVAGFLPLIFFGIVFNSITKGHEDYLYVLGLIYLAIGIFIVLTRIKIREIYMIVGYLVHGGAALMLSFGDVWPVDWIYIPFSILYLLFVLYLVKRGSLLSIIILCAMIFRFYLDISFEFLPKSFVFIIGGLLLLGFGFYFEKQRKKGGGSHE